MTPENNVPAGIPASQAQPAAPAVPGVPVPAAAPGAAPVEQFDPSLFPSIADAQAAESVWGEGEMEASKQNPIGTFQVEITEAILGRSTSSDRLQISYILTILAGPSKDTKIRKYDGLETAQQANITQQQLKRLGVETRGLKIAQIPALLLDLQGKQAVVMCKQNNQYYNIYFQRLVQADGPGGFAAAPGGSGSPSF